MEFRVLGPLEVWADDVRIRLHGPRQEIALATLLLGSEHVVSLERLADAIWNDEPPPTARRQVQNAVSVLRQRFAEAGAPGIIATEGRGYLIRAGEQLDARRFENQVSRSLLEASVGRISKAVHGLRSALGLWRGPAFAGMNAQHVEIGATGLNERRLVVLETCLEHELSLGRHADVVVELMALVAENPLRERLAAQLMLALHRSGRQADALATYHALRERLADEYGLDPGLDLRRMHQAILREDPMLRSPEQRQPAREAGQGPQMVVPAQLPADIPDFTGRTTELDQLAALIPADARAALSVPIAAVVGTAGVGKTALAVHWAHRVARHFPDGQMYVDLHGYGADSPIPPAKALSQLLRALGIEPDHIPIDVDEAVRMYRSLLATRRMLIVLDNAANSEQVRPLLPGCRSCVVLVTSRDRLAGLVAREGVRRVTLDVLPRTEAEALLIHIIGADRTGSQPDGVGRLADRCANLPLALRITAANIINDPYISVDDYAAALSRGLRAMRADDDEQAAVGRAFDFSYQRLTPAAQKMFRLLGLVPGPDVTVSAAAAVGGLLSGDAKELLERLAAAHLVQQHQASRYRFHDLLRLYARERSLAEDTKPEQELAIRRLLSWYLARVDDAAKRLYPHTLRLSAPPPEFELADLEFENHAAALAWLEAERPNLVAAISYAAEHGPHAVASLLADSLRGYFLLRRYGIDWLAVAHDGLRASVQAGDSLGEAFAHLGLGLACWSQGRYEDSIKHYTASLGASRMARSVACRAAALTNLGIVYCEIGRLREAADRYVEALRLKKQLGLPSANLHTNLGGLYREMGLLDEAEFHCRQAVQIQRETGSRGGEAKALGMLGLVYSELDREHEAFHAFTQALTLYGDIGDRNGQAVMLMNLGDIHGKNGRHSHALGQIHAAITLVRETGDRRNEANAVNTLGALHLELGDHGRAIELHRQALMLSREVGNQYQEAQSLYELSVACVPTDRQQARVHAEEALAIASRAGFGILQRQAGEILATFAGEEASPGQPVIESEEPHRSRRKTNAVPK